MVVAGNSAGGNLAAVVAQKALERSSPTAPVPAAQVLTCMPACMPVLLKLHACALHSAHRPCAGRVKDCGQHAASTLLLAMVHFTTWSRLPWRRTLTCLVART